MTRLPPLPGDPGAVRLLADRLATTGGRLSALAAVLGRLRDGATWDGPAGEAFGARLRELPPVLDAVSARLGGAASPLRALAAAMEQAQAVVSTAVRDDDDAQHAYAALEDRAYALVCAGSSEDSPDVLVVRHLQREQVEQQAAARARHAAAAEGFREADRRCALALRALAVDDVADSLAYRVVAGASRAAHDVATLGAVGVAVPELRPVAAVADAAAVAADTTLLVAYGEGSWSDLSAGAGLAATGVLGGVLRSGATAGARRTATGATVTRRLTAAQRLAIGTAREVRARRDEVRARFDVPPARGTPSALTGGPTPRAAREPLWRLTPAEAAQRVRRAAGTSAARARTAARSQADRAFLDDWRLATANGPQAQRMYVAGATLEVTATGASKARDARDARPGATRP
ncbi:hypothetical protein [Fodinibacter luteus]|uniref:hypothetical protein n=1 Tax=Fodinibacter luteus TaxID=552064 RepID=UPI0031EDCDA1